MTSKIYSAIVAGTAVLAVTLGSTAAQAATDTAEARARVLAAITLTNNTALEFGAVVAASGGGTVEITPAGTRTPCTLPLTCSGTVSAAQFDITGGTSGEVVTINADPTVTLLNTSGPGSMSATLLESAPTATLDATGAASFTVGGTLTVAASQAEGVYLGTFSVSADYQ